MNTYNRKFIRLFLSVSICFFAEQVSAQLTEIPLTKSLKNITIVSFNKPYQDITIDVDDNERDEFQRVAITTQTSFLIRNNSKMKSSPPEHFRPGMEINIVYDYYRLSQKYVAKSIVLTSDYYGRISLSGLIEKVQQSQAIINGRRVVLDSGAILTGLNEWKGVKIRKFEEFELGSEVKVQGFNKDDGLIYASKGTFQPVFSSIRNAFRELRSEWADAIYADKLFLYIGDNIKFKIVKDSSLEAYISKVGKTLVPEYLRILPDNHPDKIQFRFYIVRNEEVSSLALADGTIILYSGLLNQIENEAQLAAIISHELAHVTHYHAIKEHNFKENKLVIESFYSDSIKSALAGNESSRIASHYGLEMYTHSNERKNEAEADQVGLWYMIDAGYNPRQAALFWEKLMGLHKPDTKLMKSTSVATITANRITEMEGLLYSTHPSFKKRYEGIVLILSTVYANDEFDRSIINLEQYQEFKRRLVTYLGIPKN